MELKKELTMTQVLSVAFGAIIGWGCFVLPGDMFLPKAGPVGTAIGLSIGAVLILIVSQSYGYMIEHQPGTGGEFGYIKKAFGKTHAFIGSWFLILAYSMIIPLNATALGLLLRTFLPEIATTVKLYTIAGWDVYLNELLLALFAIFFVSFVNLRGVKLAGWFQTFVAFLLFGTVVFVTILCVSSDSASFSNLTPAFQSETENGWVSDIFAIVAVAPWALSGFDCIPQMSEEYNFPHSKSRFLMYFSVIFAVIMLLCINTVTALSMPWKQLLEMNVNWETGTSVELLAGKFGLFVLAIAMLCAIITGLNAFFMSTTRLVYAMGEEKALNSKFAKLDPKYATPKNAIIFVTILSLITPWFGRALLTVIVDMTAVGIAVVFVYTTTSAIKYAKSVGNKRQVLISSIAAAISTMFVMLLMLPFMPGFIGKTPVMLLVVWIALGAIFYFANRKRYIGE